MIKSGRLRYDSIEKLIRKYYKRTAKQESMAAMVYVSHNNQSVMVESGIGAAIVMEFSCNSDTLCLRPLEPEIISGCVLVWKKNLALSPAMVHFIAHIKECLNGTDL